jgi:hypothetical protein
MLNLHPALVHFPIALLTIYALIELARLNRMQNHPHTFTLKAFLCIIGTLSLTATYFTGEDIKEAFAVGNPTLLVERHATFALASHVIFTVLAVGYLGQTIYKTNPKRLFWKTFIGGSIHRLTETVTGKYIAPSFAFLGLIALTITGALGGAIVHGPEIDPAVQLIYRLFVR